MRRYVVDTNLYIAATRDDAAADGLKRFYGAFLPRVYLHSVVAQELLAGSIRTGLERRTRERFIEPFEALDRVITPTHEDWKRAGEIMAALVRARRMSPGGFGRSFTNDCLLAATVHRNDLVVVTGNARDFALIGAVEPVEAVPPWPTGRA